MKKIYMILAAMTLLSLSLNAQLLPGMKGNPNYATTGKANLVQHNGQHRMPTLASDEYLLGPYVTDDFDATGLSFAGFYTEAQQVTPLVRLNRSEWESHLGDSIIGFRFALAGSNAAAVFDFCMFAASNSWYSFDESEAWAVGGLNYSGGGTGGFFTRYEYHRINSVSELTMGDEYLIVCENNNVAFNGGLTTLDQGNNVIDVSNYIDNGVIESNATTDAATFTITSYSSSLYYIQSKSGYYMGYTGTSGTGLTTSQSTGSTYRNYITFSGNNVQIGGNSTSTNRRYLRFNSTSGSNNYRFRYYASTSGQNIQLYKKVEVSGGTSGTSTVDVGNGATTNGYLPARGYMQDVGYRNQMIYTSSQLGLTAGSQITSITFYPESGIGIPFYGSTVTLSVGNTTETAFNGSKITPSDLTAVASKRITATDANATAWTFTFDTPFPYTGDNLLVQVYCQGYDNDGTSGQWATSSFYGDTQNNYVSIYSSGSSASGTSGTNSYFLPKATFSYTGTSTGGIDYDYLTLPGGQWYDFYLDEPVEFVVSDTIASINIGYSYYQEYSSSFAPVAYNSNSTGHYHQALMYASSDNTNYSYAFWGIGTSPATYIPGDLAVQLIFKEAKQKTDPPTITNTQDAAYYYITATAPDSDPNAVVTLTLSNGQTATGTGYVTIPVGRGDSNVTITATATAQADGKLESDPTTKTIIVEASPLTPTPAPTIDSQVLDASVEVTGNGQGEVHMYIDGQEVTNPYYLERGTEQYTVTVTVTAQINDGDHSMTTTTTTVVVPPVNFNPEDGGWTQLPGTYNNDQVINWNNYMMFVDRFSVSTANNNQPAKYVYKMTENPTKLITPLRNTNEHTIPVQLTRSKVWGYYTEQDVLADRDRQHVDTCVINADVEMTLEQSSEIYYYTLERSRNSHEDADFVDLSELQNDGARYVEFSEFYLPMYEPFNFGAMTRFDSIDVVLPASAPQGENGKHYGKYGKDYFAYVPIIWTHGNDPANTRLNYENDHLNNSYGSPIWKTSVGKVEFVGKPQMERQDNGSTTWKEIEGTDTTKCSIYMIKSLTVDGFLPDTTISNIKYEPYMFRVWIVSSKNKLRNFEWVPGEEGRPGSHFEGRGVIPAGTAYWLWDQPVNTTSDYITFPTALKTQFHFWKTEDEDGNNQWDIAENANMIFAGQDDITADDIQILVRFYYRSTGQALYQNVQQGNGTMLMVNRDGDGEKEYYGVEEPGDPDPKIPTFIRSIYDYSQTQGEVVDVTYYNMQGMQSSKPFDGINIVVTRYSNGSVSTTKVLR